MPIGQLTFQPYVNPYVALPTKEYADLQEQLRTQYDAMEEKIEFLEEELICMEDARYCRYVSQNNKWHKCKSKLNSPPHLP